MSELQEKDRKFVWHPFTQHGTSVEHLEIVRAEGIFLYDSKGNSYIDANSSWWVNTHGHNHPKIAEAINNQFSQLDHTVFAGVTHPKAVELAERIAGLLNLNKVFFSDNGSTAVEVALKMVVQYWFNKGEDKKRFLALQGSYHGDTFGAMSLGQRGYFNVPFEPYFFEVDFIDFPNERNEQEILNRAESLFATNEFAGCIVEPLVQGASGMRMYSPSFLNALCHLAKKNNVLLIFDEVMTGFGRTGKMFAGDFCECQPDLVALSKGLTAGVMALGLTVVSDKIYDAFVDQDIAKAFLHGHSYTANPIACSVACTSLDIFEEEKTWANIGQIEKWHNSFAEAVKAYECIKNVRQQGTILAFEIETGEGGSYFSNIKDEAYKYFLNAGILLRPLGNTLFVNPPYCIQKDEYDSITTSIIRFIEEIKGKLD